MKIRIDQELASIVPPLSGKDFKHLEADLIENGQRDHITIAPCGTILDGHHRYKILGDKVHARVAHVPKEEWEPFAIRSNLARRNLSPEQKAELRSRQQLWSRARKQDGWTQERIGQVLGVKRETVRDWLNGNNGDSANVSIPDGRIKIPEVEYEKIVNRLEAGESAIAVAADYEVTPRRISQIAKKVTGAKQKEQSSAEEAAKVAIVSGVIVGNFQDNADKVEDGSLDLIFTDPPYDRDSIPLFDDLGKFAASKLREGGSLVAYLGHIQLPGALELLSKHLRYWWICCCLHAGAKARMREYGIVAGWKPMVWFVRGTRRDKRTMVDDVVSGGREKSTHKWQQAESEAAVWIEKLCPKKGSVCDPFLGGGTTLVAAKRLHRKWVGFEVSENAARKANARIAKA